MNLPPPPPSPPSSMLPQGGVSQQPHSQAQKRDSGLGSDGESPRTSDEDQNPLRFQRNHLRSYSLRHKRGNARNSNSLARSSTRRGNRSEDTRNGSNNVAHHLSSSRQIPSQCDKMYDDEVDLPDDSLLLDHVSSPTHKPEAAGSRSPPKPPRYSARAKRSLRAQPRILVEKFSTEDEEEEKEEGAVVIPNNALSRVASNSSTSTVASTVNTFDSSCPMFRNQPAVVLTNLRRVQSEDSIDTTDTESIAPSNISLLSKSTGILTEDEGLSDATTVCLTPECLLSDSQMHMSGKSGKNHLVRSRPQSRRGGSFYVTSTSEFANRRAQFKPNMLRNQLNSQSSPTHTRQSTPSFSRQNTPSLSLPSPTNDSPQRDQRQVTSPHLKTSPPPPSLLVLKQRRSSAGGDSYTASEHDTATSPSPEFLSSPPHTPVVKSIAREEVLHHLHLRRDSLEQKRESGYVSSSSESFPFTAARK